MPVRSWTLNNNKFIFIKCRSKITGFYTNNSIVHIDYITVRLTVRVLLQQDRQYKQANFDRHCYFGWGGRTHCKPLAVSAGSVCLAELLLSFNTIYLCQKKY